MKKRSDRRRVSESVLAEFGGEEIGNFDTILCKERLAPKIEDFLKEHAGSIGDIKVVTIPDGSIVDWKTERGNPADMILIDSKKLAILPPSSFHFDFDGIKEPDEEIDVIQKPVAPSVETCEPECRRV